MSEDHAASGELIVWLSENFAHINPVEQAKLSPDGSAILITCPNNQVWVWEMETNH